MTKLLIDEQALAEAGDKGEKNLGFYTGRSNIIVSRLTLVQPLSLIIFIFLVLSLILIKYRVGKDLVADLQQLGGVRILFQFYFFMVPDET